MPPRMDVSASSIAETMPPPRTVQKMPRLPSGRGHQWRRTPPGPPQRSHLPLASTRAMRPPAAAPSNLPLVHPARLPGWPAGSAAGQVTLSLRPARPRNGRTRARSRRSRRGPATDFLLSLTDGWSGSTTSLKKAFSRPSTILGIARGGLALLAGGRLGDPALVLHHVRRDVIPRWVLRPHGGDLLGQVLGRLGVRGVDLDEHAQGRRQRRIGPVQVAGHVAAVEAGEPAQLQLLLARRSPPR